MSAQHEPKTDLGVKEKWFRGLYIVLFFFIGYIVGCLITLISVFQFVCNLILKDTNKYLLDFSKNLNLYFYQILGYVTYNTEQKPYPFSPWPNSGK
jgi:hypothetical protein